MKLLLVDDDAFLRDMYALKFTQSGYTVDVADGAAAALAKIGNTKDYDLVLLDMIMPGLSGIDLIKSIKEQFPDLGSKFAILSNQGEPKDQADAKAAGADGYIIKAETIPSEVVKKVEDILKK